MIHMLQLRLCLQTRAKPLAFNNANGQFSPNNLAAYRADKAIQMVFSNLYRVFNKFDSLLNFRFFNWLTTPRIAAVTAIRIKRDCFINLIGFKRLTIDAFMTGLAALSSRACCRFRFGRLDDIRRWRFGEVGGILREFSSLVSNLSVDFKRFGDTLNIELFFFGGQISSSSRLLWLLSGERGPPFEKTSIVSLNYNFEYVTR
ncbi:MAG: hypothetical protein ABIG61_04175 [Planctomycetota bacterium]